MSINVSNVSNVSELETMTMNDLCVNLIAISNQLTLIQEENENLKAKLKTMVSLFSGFKTGVDVENSTVKHEIISPDNGYEFYEFNYLKKTIVHTKQSPSTKDNYTTTSVVFLPTENIVIEVPCETSQHPAHENPNFSKPHNKVYELLLTADHGLSDYFSELTYHTKEYLAKNHSDYNVYNDNSKYEYKPIKKDIRCFGLRFYEKNIFLKREGQDEYPINAETFSKYNRPGMKISIRFNFYGLHLIGKVLYERTNLVKITVHE